MTTTDDMSSPNAAKAEERPLPRQEEQSAHRTSLGQRAKGMSRNPLSVTFGLFVLLCILIGIDQPLFLTGTNILNVLRQSSFIMIIAVAGTLVMVSGGIDISVPGVAALAGIVATKLAVAGIPLVLVILGGVASGAIAGFASGLLAVQFGVTPIIATLGMLYVAQGLAFIISNGSAIVIGVPPSFSTPGQSHVAGVPTPVIIAAAVVVVFYLLLHRTLLGKYTYAIGGNPETARLSGLPVQTVQTTLYVLSGGATGLSGVLLASRLGSGQPLADDSLIFNVIIAIVLGGTALAGGAGTIVGTVIGALFVSVLGNGLDLIGVQAFYQYVALGVVLILAALIDVSLRGQSSAVARLARLWTTRRAHEPDG